MIKNEHLFEIFTEDSRYIAASQAFNVNIILFRSDYGGPFIYKCENAKQTCLIGYEADTHYVSLKSFDSNDYWIETYLASINIDCPITQEPSSSTTVTITINNKETTSEKKKKFEKLFLTKIVDLDAFINFQEQIENKYETKQIIQNPCYLLLEADTFITKQVSLINRIQSIAKTAFFMNKKSDLFDSAVNRLEQAIAIDPIFAFSAYISYAHIIIHKHVDTSTYKVEAKSKLLEAYQQIEEHILPQHYSMRIPSINGIDEIFFDDFAQQTETKITLLELYKIYIKRAIEAIERSQSLINIYVNNNNGKMYIGKQLYRQKAQEFVNKYHGMFDLRFYDLKVVYDIVKNDQAIELLKLLQEDKNRVSIHLMNVDVDLEQIESIMSKINLNKVCLNIENLHLDEIVQIIENDRVDLMVSTLKEEYQKIITVFPGKITLVMDSIAQDFSSLEALKYLESNTNNNVNSIMLTSINREMINTLLQQQVEQAICTLTFNDISIARVQTIINCISKPFSISFKKLLKQIAYKLVDITDVRRNMILDLHDLTKENVNNILKKFLENINRNEHDITATLKNLADIFSSKSDQPTEELNGYAYMGVQQFLLINELNPRPWKSIIILNSIGAFQIIGGICVAALTSGIGFNIGMALIFEGINDIIYAIKSARSRTISWTDYAQNKGISLLLSFLSIGLSLVGHAAIAAFAQTHDVSQVLHKTSRGALNTVQESFSRLQHTVTQETAIQIWRSIRKQVMVTCVGTCIQIASNHSILFTVEQIMLQLRPAITKKIEDIVNTEYNNDYLSRLLTQALNADTYNGNRQWQEKIEQQIEHTLRNEKNVLTKTIQTFANEIWSRLNNQSKSSIQGAITSNQSTDTNPYDKSHFMKQTYPSILTIINGDYHMKKITELFFNDLYKSLTKFEQKIPTFQQLLIHASQRSISLEIADGIYQLLLQNNILTNTDSINVYQDNTSNFSKEFSNYSALSTSTMKQNVDKINFTDAKHKECVLIVLNKLLQRQQNSLRIDMLRRIVINHLVVHIINKLTMFYHKILSQLTNFGIARAMSTLSQDFSQLFNPKTQITDRTIEIDTERTNNIGENNIFNNIQPNNTQYLPNTTTQILNFQMKNNQYEYLNSNYLLSIVATLINKPISVIQQQITNELIQDMRISCNAFIQANPVYVAGILPIIQNRKISRSDITQ